MMLRTHTFMTIMLLMTIVSGSLKAQTKAISTTWALNGIGIGYEIHTGDESFLQIDLTTEISEIYFTRSWNPGAVLSFSWNTYFAQTETIWGDMIRFYAGPGAALGWTPDIKAGSGAMFGVKGRIGAECTFERHASISLAIAPVLGMHLSSNGNAMNMRIFRNGLIYGVIPEIGIKYAF